MHSRCCCPPDNPIPGASSRSFTSSHSPAARSDCSTRSFSFTPRAPINRSPAATLSNTDIVGNGLGFWKTMPTVRRTETTSTESPYTSRSSSRTEPVARALGTSSCMRFTQRTMVDLPQPDGPMIAVTSLGGNSSETSATAWLPP